MDASLPAQTALIALQHGSSIMEAAVIGLDIAKNVFQVHGNDASGRAVLRRQLRRADLLRFFANLPACTVGIEACGTAHYWARRLAELGHSVKLIAPQFVRAFVKSNKNDSLDAEAIAEAVVRPNMRFVTVKSPTQQSILALHRARDGLVRSRVALTNQVQGLLAEFGFVLAGSHRQLPRQLPSLADDESNDLPGPMRALLRCLCAQLNDLLQRIGELEKEIHAWHRQDERSRRLEAIPGIGPITASALAASVPDANTFKNGRQMAAWLGLVPRQQSTGGKSRLLGISKRGDSYLRRLLVHGARAVLRQLTRAPARESTWSARLVARRHPNVVICAIANKNARIAWALLSTGQEYCPH